MRMSYVLLHSQTEQAPDSNCVSKDNAGYSADDQNHVIFATLDDGGDTDRTTNTAADVPVDSPERAVPEAANKNYSKHGDNGVLASGDEQQGMRSLILIMALSLHHLFEGVTLGLQRTVAGVFTLLIALLCHETIISFSLGLQFVKCSYTKRQHYITAFVCSIVEPIGIAIGRYNTLSQLACCEIYTLGG